LKPARLKLLFVCSRNRRRSLTAEVAFAKHPDWDARSAGTEPSARIRVTSGLIGWADIVFVMEKRHREILAERYGETFSEKRCVCLFIPDEFEFMDPDLIALLDARVREHLG
jgi:predicted protein tyrosine phosphatase